MAFPLKMHPLMAKSASAPCKVVLLAGGLGTRLSEDTSVRPKPMVEIGGMPILWHIMKIYSAHGFNEFVICLGYRGYMIKEYFSNYFLHTSDVTFDMRSGAMEVHSRHAEPWTVTLVDTGAETMTGGRLRRVRPYLKDAGTFMLTYGDGLADVDLGELLEFHRARKLTATVTAVQPPGRFGTLDIDSKHVVRNFTEKPAGDGARINGGFFVFEQGIFDRLEGDSTILEQEPLRGLAEAGELAAYHHAKFWQPMDTMRDRLHLEQLWNSRQAPWKIW